MFSRILTKLIDEAILPATFLIASKVIGVVVIMRYFNIPLADGSSYFPLYFANHSDFVKVNSYSNLFMIAVVSIGAVLFLFKSRVLHETHLSPPRAARIFGLRLGGMIKTSFDLYSEGAIWLSYSYLVTMMLGVYLYLKLLYVEVFFLSLAVTVLLTLILISDVEREV